MKVTFSLNNPPNRVPNPPPFDGVSSVTVWATDCVAIAMDVPFAPPDGGLGLDPGSDAGSSLTARERFWVVVCDDTGSAGMAGCVVL